MQELRPDLAERDQAEAGEPRAQAQGQQVRAAAFMYHHLSGKLAHKSPGVGRRRRRRRRLRSHRPAQHLREAPGRGGSVHLLTHLHVREDGMRLFGFLTAEERELFRMLIAVSGIGPMLAMAVLSGTSVESVKQAVLAGDAALLKKIRGIGTKTAERMVLELRDPIVRLGVRAGVPGRASSPRSTRFPHSSRSASPGRKPTRPSPRPGKNSANQALGSQGLLPLVVTAQLFWQQGMVSNRG